MKVPAAALFSSFSFLCLLASPLTVRPALAHALVDVQADLQQREPAVAFEPDVGSPFPSFSLEDPNGKAVELASLRGKVVVVEFISTECADGCSAQSDAQSQLMSQIQADVAAGRMADQVQLISISLDPAHDTPTLRRAYGPAHGLKPQNWTFLAGGTAEDAQRLARAAGLKFDRQADGSLTHPPVTFVVDSAGMLRAKFFGLKYDPLNLLVYVNALTNDHHEIEQPPASSAPSFWDTLKRHL